MNIENLINNNLLQEIYDVVVGENTINISVIFQSNTLVQSYQTQQLSALEVGSLYLFLSRDNYEQTLTGFEVVEAIESVYCGGYTGRLSILKATDTAGSIYYKDTHILLLKLIF